MSGEDSRKTETLTLENALGKLEVKYNTLDEAYAGFNIYFNDEPILGIEMQLETKLVKTYLAVPDLEEIQETFVHVDLSQK